MTLRRNPPPIRAPEQGEKIIVGSPLAIVGIFVSILRERYKPGNGPPDHAWQEDLTKTGIVIESGFSSIGPEERNKKPGIFVDKDESVYGKIVIGDRAAVDLKTMKDVGWTLSTVPVLIECISNRKGESAVIGDIVQWTLHASSDAIQAAFSFHDMSPPTLGRTVPYESEQESWTTPVSFQVQYNVRWSTEPIKPLLNEVRTTLRQANAESPEEALIQIVLRSSANLPDC
jgi:hypothetical protein